MAAFYRNVDLDPSDTVKIATVRHFGLLKEKLHIGEAMGNIHSHYASKSDMLKDIIAENKILSNLEPLLFYFEQFYRSVAKQS